MKKTILLLMTTAVLTMSCSQYNTVLKYGDPEYKYEEAKSRYVRGQYARAMDLFGSVLAAMKGSSNAEECLFMLAMSAYQNGDLETSSSYFRKYYQSYPRGTYVEQAYYYSGRSLYESVPDVRLDQTVTMEAIAELQNFLDHYPYTRLKEQTQDMILRLQDHLIEKEYLAAKLYYDLGSYMANCAYGGSNYEACIITAENARRDFPYASPERREQFAMLILRSKYHLARQSVEEKRLHRFRETIDEYYGFVNEYPESEYLREARTYLERAQRALKGQPLEDE